MTTKVLLTATTWYLINGSLIPIEHMSPSGVEVNRTCAKAMNDSDCEARAVLKKVELKELSPERLRGGKNPGAVLCRLQPNAQIKIGLDSKKNENSFCLFHDGSVVTTGSLLEAARKNSPHP